MARVEDDVHLLVLHLVILPFLTVEEDPIGTFLPVLFLVTWPTFNIIDNWKLEPMVSYLEVTSPHCRKPQLGQGEGQPANGGDVDSF